ncbi:MAG TPA: pyruvate kinase, partial [Geobacteraceae bacterium]
MSAQSPPVPGEELIRELNELREAMLEMAATCAPLYEGLPEGRRASMENLLHYLALRQRDIRPLQHRLAELGLSSLGRAESHVLASINSLLSVLHRLATTSAPPLPAATLDFASGPALLDQNTDLLFGQRPGSRRVRIMVTMPSEAAEDYLLVRDLVDAGMNCMRINCAHDGPEAWERMVENLRRARRELGRKCRVLMDLGGPKLRTGPLEVCHQVMRVRPKRDEYGRVTEPARIWLV